MAYNGSRGGWLMGGGLGGGGWGGSVGANKKSWHETSGYLLSPSGSPSLHNFLVPGHKVRIRKHLPSLGL